MDKKDQRAKRKAKQQAKKTGVPGSEVSQKHEPVLRIRRFTSVDFSQLSYIMPPEWKFEGLTQDQETAQANMDFAGVLAKSNVRLVATVDDGTDYDSVLVGILFARVEKLDPPKDGFVWEGIYESASQTLRNGAKPAWEARDYEMQLSQRGQLLIDAAGDGRGEDNELELFVVSPKYRGKGYGKALMNAFCEKLEELGCESYWLQTDSTCAWQWYENAEFTREADVELGPEFKMPGSREDDERPHAFMYRKQLTAME